jgi:hypothetical protein
MAGSHWSILWLSGLARGLAKKPTQNSNSSANFNRCVSNSAWIAADADNGTDRGWACGIDSHSRHIPARHIAHADGCSGRASRIPHAAKRHCVHVQVCDYNGLAQLVVLAQPKMAFKYNFC